MSPKFSNPTRRCRRPSGTGGIVGLILTIVLLCIVVVVIKDCHGGGHVFPPALEHGHKTAAGETLVKMLLGEFGHMRSGDADNEIVRLATKESADLIVIATHGVTGWRHLVFSSVAEKVIRLSERPFLVIPIHDSN